MLRFSDKVFIFLQTFSLNLTYIPAKGVPGLPLCYTMYIQTILQFTFTMITYMVGTGSSSVCIRSTLIVFVERLTTVIRGTNVVQL